jgi:5-methylcytosine-specific restriction protein A
MSWDPKRRHTRADRKTTAAVLTRAGHHCQIRGPNCTGVGTEDDHIVPLSQGGTNNMNNRQAACHSCHTEKTQREAAAAQAAAAQRGRPPKAKHPGLK